MPSTEVQQYLHAYEQRQAEQQRQGRGGFVDVPLNEPVSSSVNSANADVELQLHGTNLAKGKEDVEHNNKILEPISAAHGRPPLVLCFNNLSVWAPVNPKKDSIGTKALKTLMCSRGEINPKRQILNDVSGQVHPGEVLALMGPSGSGKTTLLTVLGGRSKMDFEGQVTVNDSPFTKAIRRRVGFVLQDDVLYESLTVTETLTYAALLRLPKGMSHADKIGRVEQVIDALGLRKSKDTIIGGFFRRGVSGGERKRVSIGHELLINPAIILLDEPTSGLDSTTAMHLLTLLQDLAAGSRSIATTIHQPSSRLYRKLDRLMLLAEGHMAYSGKADQVLDWFAQFGYKIPFGVSIADYILDISLGEAGYSSSGKTGSAAVKELYESFEAQFAGKNNKHKAKAGFSYTAMADGSSDDRNDVRASAQTSTALPVLTAALAMTGTTGAIMLPTQSGGAAADGVQHSSSNRGNGSSIRRHSPHQGASYFEQLRVLAQRSGRVWRFEQMTAQHFFQLFGVAFIAGMVCWQRGQQYNGGIPAATDVLGLLFFMLITPALRVLYRALFTFPNEFRILMKERPSGMYNLSAYYIARTAANIPAELLNTVLFVVITYWFGGLRHSAAGFFGLLSTLVLVTAVAESWGLLIGAVFMEPKTAQTVTTVLMLAFVLVAGYYARNISIWVSWIRQVSFLSRGYNLLIKSQLSGLRFFDCSSGSCQPVAWEAVPLPVHPDEPAYPDVLVLIGMLVFLRLVIYFVLRHKTTVKQKSVR